MTKKHYELIAEAIKEAVEEYRNVKGGKEFNAVNATAITIALALKSDNVNFDYFRFLNACGL